MANHQIGLLTILVKIKILKNGIKAFQPACPALPKILNQDIKYNIKVNPKIDAVIIKTKPSSFVLFFGLDSISPTSLFAITATSPCKVPTVSILNSAGGFISRVTSLSSEVSSIVSPILPERSL